MREIATSSIDEVLDFGFNLIIPAVAIAGQNDPTQAQSLLNMVAEYVSLRYAGEVRLAFEYLEGIADAMPNEIDPRREQFEQQLNWLREALGHEDA